jgi:hypothetical protein
MFVAQLAYDAFKKVLTATTQTMVKSIRLATDFEEANSKLFTVFSDVSNEASKMRQNLVDSFGLSKKAATELLGSTGDLLTGFGFSQQSALELSNSVQELAVDLASFTNFSGGAEGASAALTKALLGERESVKSLGISILEADVKAKVLELTQQGLTFETERQAKAYATLLIAQQQSKNASGDFARTQDQLANRQRRLLAVFEDIQVILGQTLTPILNDMAGALLENAQGVRDFLESTEGVELLASIFAGISAGVQVAKTAFSELADIVTENLEGAFDGIMESLGSLFEEMQGNISAFDIFAGILKIIGIGLTVAIKLITLQVQAFIDWNNAIKESGILIAEFFLALSGKGSWEKFKTQLADTGDSFKDFGENIVTNGKDIVDTVVEEFKGFPKGVQESSKEIEKIWNTSFSASERAFLQHKKNLENINKEGNKNIVQETETAWSKLVKKIGEKNALLQENFDETGKKILSTTQFVFGQLAGIYNDIFDTVLNGLDNELEAIKNQGEEKIQVIETEKEQRLTMAQEDFESQKIMLDEKLANDVITQEEHDNQLSLLEQQKADTTTAIQAEMDRKLAEQKQRNRDKENAKEKQIFEANKANQIANVWIQAAIGIVGAWAQSIAQLGPIAGAVFAGILTAAILGVAIAQTVVIGQQQFIPRKQEGGMASGLTMINEGGMGEIVNLPDGSLVIPNDISSQIARNVGNVGGGKQVIINNSFKGAVIDSNMSLNRVTTAVSREMSRRLTLSEG